MTDAQKIERIKSLTQKRRAKATADDSLKRLIEDGIYTDDGKLAPEYGGPKKIAA
jgi:hypothetical protein